MRKIYTFLMYLLMPWILVRLFLKGRRQPEYRKRLKERFMLDPQEKSFAPVDVWVHAVSLGEVIAAAPLVDQLIKAGYVLLLTTMTPTGSLEVQRRFGQTVTHCYLPYDYPYAVNRFFSQYTPTMGVIMETELWPNLIAIAFEKEIPLLLANARLSPQSMKHYRKVSFFFKPILACFKNIFAQSEQDQQFFLELGALPSQLSIQGNMKFDIVLPSLKTLPDQPVLIHRKVWLVASTHEGEETWLLEVFARLKESYPDLLLMMAPRHVDRFDRVYQLCCDQQWRVERRSLQGDISSHCDIFLIDTLGELVSFYALCDVAFVGGSLVPIGGHNVLEPIAQKKPVICGPYMQNSQNIVTELLVAKALIQVSEVKTCVDAVALLLQPEVRAIYIENALAVLDKNRGAVARHLEWIWAICDKDDDVQC